MSMMEPFTPDDGQPQDGLADRRDDVREDETEVELEEGRAAGTEGAGTDAGIDFDDADFGDDDPAAPSVFRTPRVGEGLSPDELRDDLRDEERDDQLGD